MAIKVTVIAGNADRLSAIAGQLPLSDPAVLVTKAVGGARDLVAEIERGHPEVVVAELPSVPESDLQLLAAVLNASPGTAVVLVASDRSPDFLIRLMRAGVREVVPIGADGDELKAAYLRQMGRMTSMRAPAPRGRVVAFVPAKGGSGATFLSTNLAYALSRRGARTAILDLNLHFGDAAIFISETRAAGNVADVARQVDRLDGTFLEASMLAVSENLWLLSAPESPESAIDISPEAVERIIAVARSRYDFVVLDVGRIFEAVSVRALDQADEIYIVLQPTLPFIHDAKRLIGMMTNIGYPREKLRLVLNRLEKGGDISEDDVRKSLGLPVSLSVPNNFRTVAFSINHGIPILKYAPRDVVSKAILTLAESLAPAPQRRGGWLRALAGVRT